MISMGHTCCSKLRKINSVFNGLKIKVQKCRNSRNIDETCTNTDSTAAHVHVHVYTMYKAPSNLGQLCDIFRLSKMARSIIWGYYGWNAQSTIAMCVQVKRMTNIIIIQKKNCIKINNVDIIWIDFAWDIYLITLLNLYL